MRESGILLHITSLPGDHGIGTLGKHSFAFVDFLEKAGQHLWQVLPLNPTGYGNSPYQSCSAFAGNPYLIDLELLTQEGLLQPEDLVGSVWEDEPGRVSFGKQYDSKLKILRKAFSRFTANDEFRSFCSKNSSWLSDFSLFMALKDKFAGKPWYQWDEPLKRRDPDAIWASRQLLRDEVRFYSFVQFLFYRQWDALHTYAAEKGIRMIGDVPIYVPLDSAEVWSSPEFFQLDEDLAPTAVAGCPPDAFTADGQLWGNPLYDWDAMKADGYTWWIRRLSAAGKLVDCVRMDHFRGLESYWSVPYGDETARNGKWVKGPGMDFIRAIQKAIPGLNMIAEDLGFLTQEVLDLRDDSGYPGMKVLQFAFDSREPSDYLPHTYIKNTVCYTGTHDNMTMQQWFDTADADAVEYAAKYLNLSVKEGYVWGVIRTAMASVSDTCIVPMQDYLNLGASARMNFPGTQSSDNWTWRMEEDALTDALAEKILHMTRLYCRTPRVKTVEATASTEQ